MIKPMMNASKIIMNHTFCVGYRHFLWLFATKSPAGSFHRKRSPFLPEEGRFAAMQNCIGFAAKQSFAAAQGGLFCRKRAL